MPDIVISDTSCLVILDKIDHLLILTRLYNKVTTTPEIAQEYENPLPDWIRVEALGLLVKAKKAGIIKQVKPIVKRIKGAGFRFSDAVELDILSQAGEL